MDKDYCVGCRDNFYNGNNNLGVKECWCLKDAKLVMKKEVHIDQAPPPGTSRRKNFQIATASQSLCTLRRTGSVNV